MRVIFRYSISNPTAGKIIFISGISVFFFFIQSCRRDIAIPPNSEIQSSCIPIPPYSGTGFGYNYLVDTNYLMMPSFNPNNPNEFVYVYKNYNSGQTEIYKYDLTNNTKQLIYSGNIIFPPKWGGNDWILLNPSDENVWKIKANGDSLIQLTTSAGNFYPEWNPEANKIIFFNSDINKSIIISSIGVPLDTLEKPVHALVNWGTNNWIATLSVSFGLEIFDSYGNNSTGFIPDNFSQLGGCFWINNSVLWANSDGIYSTQFPSLNTSLIKATCNSKTYLFASYSQLSEKIIWQKVDRSLINEDLIEVKSRLFIMNADGTDEQEIIIE